MNTGTHFYMHSKTNTEDEFWDNNNQDYELQRRNDVSSVQV